jgi:predicted  nucleic acid-binding Zn-ribbon protein
MGLPSQDVSFVRPDEEISSQQERLAALSSDVSTALVRVHNQYEALSHCCEAIVSHLDAALARIWTLNPASDAPDCTRT